MRKPGKTAHAAFAAGIALLALLVVGMAWTVLRGDTRANAQQSRLGVPSTAIQKRPAIASAACQKKGVALAVPAVGRAETALRTALVPSQASAIYPAVAFSNPPGEPITPERARKAAEKFLDREKQRVADLEVSEIPGHPAPDALQGVLIAQTTEIKQDDGMRLAYVHSLEPAGYIVTSANSAIRPVIAFSFKNSFDFTDSKKNVLLHLVRADMKARLRLANEPSAEMVTIIQSNFDQWKEY